MLGSGLKLWTRTPSLLTTLLARYVPYFLEQMLETLYFPQASVKLASVDLTGAPIKLELFSPNSAETHLSYGQVTAIYRLFC